MPSALLQLLVYAASVTAATADRRLFAPRTAALHLIGSAVLVQGKSGHGHNPHHHCPHDHYPHAHTPHAHVLEQVAVDISCNTDTDCLALESYRNFCVDSCRFVAEKFDNGWGSDYYDDDEDDHLGAPRSFMNRHVGSAGHISAFGFNECAEACCSREKASCSGFVVDSDGRCEFNSHRSEQGSTAFVRSDAPGVCAEEQRAFSMGDGLPDAERRASVVDTGCDGSTVRVECNPLDQKHGLERCVEERVNYCKPGSLEFVAVPSAQMCDVLTERYGGEWKPGADQRGMGWGNGWALLRPCTEADDGKCRVCPQTSCYNAEFKWQCMHPGEFLRRNPATCSARGSSGAGCVGDNDECMDGLYCTLLHECSSKVPLGSPCPGNALSGTNFTSYKESREQWLSAYDPGCDTDYCETKTFLCERKCVADGDLCPEVIGAIVGSVFFVIFVGCCCCMAIQRRSSAVSLAQRQQQSVNQQGMMMQQPQPIMMTQQQPVMGQVVGQQPMVVGQAPIVMATPLQQMPIMAGQQMPIMAVAGQPVVVGQQQQNVVPVVVAQPTFAMK